MHILRDNVANLAPRYTVNKTGLILLLSILPAGNERANEQADQTLSEVRTAMQMVY